ncbi:MAG: hypothetical protein AAFX99_19385 [Myxococcota bacterium]
MNRHYNYVGPDDIRTRVADHPAGFCPENRTALLDWLIAHTHATRGEDTFTFVVGTDGRLRLADRHSEHVACSGGAPVLAAGEMTLDWTCGTEVYVAMVSNLSTGFCPEPTCWDAIALALEALGLGHDGELTYAFDYRRCPACGSRNVIKDGYFVCDVCGEPLPEAWNF